MWNRIKTADRATLAVVGAILAIVLLLAINLVVSLGLGGARVDLTENKIYTVSQSTRDVLGSLEEPVTLRLYMSSGLVEEAPSLRVYSDRVRQLLKSYEQIAGGKLRVEQTDPIPFSSEEDEAMGYSLAGFNLSQAGEQGYFGVVGTNSVDGVETIPALTPSRENYLEYDLTRLIARLAHPTVPKVGIIDGLNLMGDPVTQRRPAAVISRIAQDYELVPVYPDATAIPDGLSALLIVHPFNLTPSALYAIDQFAIRGGGVLAFLDAIAEHDVRNAATPTNPQNPGSSLGPLMAAWGVAMDPTQVAGDISMAIKIRGRAGAQVVVADYPPWMIIDRDNLNPDDAVTGQLTLMRIATSGAIEHIASSKTVMTPLIQTTPNSMMFTQAQVMRRDDPTELTANYAPSGVQRVLAARLTGEVDTAFPGGAPPAPPPSENADAPLPPPALVTHSQKPLNVIIVGDTDVLSNDMNVGQSGQPTTQNADFVINALDSLTGGGQLIALRGQGLSFRPFTTVDRIEAAANEKYRATEDRLQTELKDTQEKLAALMAQNGGASQTGEPSLEGPSPEQQQAITEFNTRLVDVRQQLRDVRGALRSEIDALGDRLRLINILAVPLLIVLAGIAAFAWRQLRLSRYLRRRSAD
ncbi:MAG TPA: Gldg family protein [Devosia sp.]|nr:Gldg family protein [Devosia sp.]